MRALQCEGWKKELGKMIKREERRGVIRLLVVVRVL